MENAEKEKEIYKEYRDTLQTLTVNSKPLIDVLTEVADENKNYAHVIAQCIEDQLENVSLNLKLPILYLIDSIIKCPATWQSYTRLFFPKLIPMFVRIYKESKDEVRTKLSKLRFTWSGVLPFEILEVLDKTIRKINPAWQAAPQAHINPLFIQNTAATRMIASTNSTVKAIPVTEESLKQEQRQLRALKHKKLELEKELKMLRSKQPVINANVLPKSAPKDVSTVVEVGTSLAKVTPASCIAPASNESTNTTITRRVRDPRLRKIEQDEGPLIRNKVPIMSATTVKDSKPAVTTVQVDYKVDKENVLLADTATIKNGVTSPPKNVSNSPRVPPVPLTEPESPPAPAIDRKVNSNANDDSHTRTKSRLKRKELSPKPDVKSKIKVRVETANKNTEKNASESSPEKNASSPVKSKDTRDERSVSGSSIKATKSKLKFMVERWANCDEEKKRKFIDEMSKVNPKTTAKFVKLLEKNKKFSRIPKINADTTRGVTVIDTINVEDSVSIDESKRESAAKTTDSVKLTNCKDVSSCADMDVDTDTCIATNVRASTNKSSGTDEKSPSIDLTEQRCENEKKRNDENDLLRMEMLKLEQEEKNLEADIQKCTTEIKEQSSLSEQLEAVMNATSNQKAETFSHSIDIRTLLPVVVNEMISAAPFTAATTAVEAVPSFNNPFGLAQPIKDVDYRQLFAAFPQPQPAVVSSSRAFDDALPASKVDRVETVDDAFASSPRRRRNADGDEESNPKVKRRRTTDDTCDNDDYDNSQFSNDSDNDSGGDTQAKRRRREDASALDSLANVETQARNDTIMTSTAELPQPPMFPLFGFPMMNPNFNVISSTKPEVPEANYDILRMIERDPTKEMDLFGKRREVRHYGTTAVIFLNWDDPRQVSYYNGQRTIIIDNNIKIRVDLNRPDVEKMVYGRPHRFRLGTPTRELYIDGIGYECCFNGPPIQVRFGDVLRSVSLVGREPGKDIGKCKRTDLVAGKINIIIDEEFAFPVFLDSKPQSIIIDNLPFVIMFIDALKRIVINDVPFAAEFGGLSQSFKFRNKVHCFRLTSLPVGIVPGSINIFQMVMTKLPLPPPLPPSLQYPALSSTVNEPKPQPNILQNLDIDELFQKLVASGVVPSSSSSTVADAKSNENCEEIIKTVDFEKPETLKQKQPVLVSKLYSGVQCSSCGLRFSCDQAVKYDQHLDWHFRLNRKSKSGARVISSRKWYYNSQDWMKFQEMEDVDDREQNWFENHPVGGERNEEDKEEIPCVVVGENDQNACCDLCKDRFEQFYNQDVEEWLLRNAVRVETALYHPLCYKDYQERNDHSDVEEIVETIEPINVDDITVVEESVIAVDDTSVLEKSDNTIPVQESEVGIEADATKELVTIKQEKPDSHTATTTPRAVELNVPKESNEDETDSDVEEVELIEQPIEQIVINDDYDDIEESNLETLHSEDIVEAENEELAANRDEASVEPLIGDEHVIDDDDAQHSPTVDITHCVSNIVSIDGNIDMGESMPPMNTTTKIKINITKIRAESKSPPPSTAAAKQPESEEAKNAVSNAETDALSSDTSVDRQALSSVEKLTASETKEKLKNRNLTEYPPVSKGTETSGLCSIM